MFPGTFRLRTPTTFQCRKQPTTLSVGCRLLARASSSPTSSFPTGKKHRPPPRPPTRPPTPPPLRPPTSTATVTMASSRKTISPVRRTGTVPEIDQSQILTKNPLVCGSRRRFYSRGRGNVAAHARLAAAGSTVTDRMLWIRRRRRPLTPSTSCQCVSYNLDVVEPRPARAPYYPDIALKPPMGHLGPSRLLLGEENERTILAGAHRCRVSVATPRSAMEVSTLSVVGSFPSQMALAAVTFTDAVWERLHRPSLICGRQSFPKWSLHNLPKPLVVVLGDDCRTAAFSLFVCFFLFSFCFFFGPSAVFFVLFPPGRETSCCEMFPPSVHGRTVRLLSSPHCASNEPVAPRSMNFSLMCLVIKYFPRCPCPALPNDVRFGSYKKKRIQRSRDNNSNVDSTRHKTSQWSVKIR